jgi:hypothetical protein
MADLPVDHRLRSAYRVMSALAGAYVLVFGILAITRTAGTALFAQTGLPWVMGLRTNTAFAIASIAAGVVIIAAALIGRNIDVRVNILGSAGFLSVGTLMLGLMSTNANFLGFSMVNCIVSYIIGTLLLTAGLYGKTVRTRPPVRSSPTSAV